MEFRHPALIQQPDCCRGSLRRESWRWIVPGTQRQSGPGTADRRWFRQPYSSTPGTPGVTNGYANCNFTNVIQYANTASSNYHGLQSELRIGGWHGVSATASYTYSKTIDNASEVFSTVGGGNTLGYSQSPFNPGGPERANSGTDFPHVV